MKRRQFLRVGLGQGLALAALPVLNTTLNPALATPVTSPGQADLAWHRRAFNALGTSMEVRVGHADPARAEAALDAAVAELRHIEDQMSLFRPDSALCQLNREGWLSRPHPDLLRILRTAQAVSRRSGGAFDVTVQPLWQVYAAAQAQGRLPTPEALAQARARVGWQGLQVQSDGLRLLHPGMGVTLNGIAQGFAADQVRRRLQEKGIAHALIDAGEWASLGQPDHAGDWTLGVADPHQPGRLITGVALQGRCLATSADDQCSFSPDRRFHHIFDPHAGCSPTGLSCVSVLAPSAVMADALTKVFFVGGYDRALPLARQWGVDVLVVDKGGRWQASPGFPVRPG